jgi:excisionase family DNA binding protein
MSNPEHLLNVRELAAYMHLSDRTILKMAAAGTLPGAKIGVEWRFKRELIDAWLAERMSGGEKLEDMELVEVPDGAGLPLGEILEERGIVSEIGAKDAVSAIEALAARASANGWITDKAWLVQAVVAREQLASTAMEGGVAFLHTRERNATKINRPFVVMGRSHAGIDFGAPDNKPTHLFFLLGLKHDRLHLPILGRLARVLRRPEIVRTLRAAPGPSRMRDTLLQEDVKLMAAEAERRKALAGSMSAVPAPAEKKKTAKKG